MTTELGFARHIRINPNDCQHSSQRGQWKYVMSATHLYTPPQSHKKCLTFFCVDITLFEDTVAVETAPSCPRGGNVKHNPTIVSTLVIVTHRAEFLPILEPRLTNLKRQLQVYVHCGVPGPRNKFMPRSQQQNVWAMHVNDLQHVVPNSCNGLRMAYIYIYVLRSLALMIFNMLQIIPTSVGCLQ